MSASNNHASSAGGKGRRAVDSCRDEFTLVVENGKPKMQCNHCGVAITNHTATLKNHLARKHGDAGTNGGDVKESAVVGPATTEEDDGDEVEDVVEEQLVEKTRSEKPNGKQNGGGAVIATAVSAPLEQPTAADAKKEAKKRTQRSSNDKGSSCNCSKDREEAEQPEKDDAEAKDGTDKKRKLADVAEEVETAANAVEEEVVMLPLIDRQEFADMNRGMSCTVQSGYLYRRLYLRELMLLCIAPRNARVRRGARADHQEVARDPQVQVR